MFKRARYAALLGVPATALAILAILAMGYPLLGVVLFPPAIQLPFFLAAQVSGSRRAVDAALISTRFTGALMMGGGVVVTIACMAPIALFLTLFGALLLLAAGTGASEARLAGAFTLTAALLAADAFVFAWVGMLAAFFPALLMLLAGCIWALEVAVEPRPLPGDEIQLPRACARFCR